MLLVDCCCMAIDKDPKEDVDAGAGEAQGFAVAAAQLTAVVDELCRGGDMAPVVGCSGCENCVKQGARAWMLPRSGVRVRNDCCAAWTAGAVAVVGLGVDQGNATVDEVPLDRAVPLFGAVEETTVLWEAGSSQPASMGWAEVAPD